LFYRDADEQAQLLVDALRGLYEAGFAAADIVVLSTRSQNEVASWVSTEPWQQRLKRYGTSQASGYIRYCSVHAFKGLEAGAVIITDLDDFTADSFEALAYIGITRALHRLVLLMHHSVKPFLLRAQKA
jgi:superfamily I DNA/RNA helicase